MVYITYNTARKYAPINHKLRSTHARDHVARDVIAGHRGPGQSKKSKQCNHDNNSTIHRKQQANEAHGEQDVIWIDMYMTSLRPQLTHC